MLGQRIEKYRKKKNLTLEQLADKVESSKSYIWELENMHDSNPSVYLVYKISMALNVPMESLICDDSEYQTTDDFFCHDYRRQSSEIKKRLRYILTALCAAED